MRISITSSIAVVAGLCFACQRNTPTLTPVAEPSNENAAARASDDVDDRARNDEKARLAADPTSDQASPDATNGAAALPKRALPRACADADAKMCTPPASFAHKLCQGKFPGVAIAMFNERAPWTKAYVRMREIEPMNTLGGPSGSNNLVFAEEVVVLHHRASKKGPYQVSGNAAYHVLRWDGTCVTVGEEQIVTWMPGLPQNAPIVWNYLSDPIQEALLGSDRVKTARATHRAECRGASRHNLSVECERATRKLNDAVVSAVRAGIELPEPSKLPDWAPSPEAVPPNEEVATSRSPSGSPSPQVRR